MTTTRTTSLKPLVLIGTAAALGSAACMLAVLPAYVATSLVTAVWWTLAGLGQMAVAVWVLRRPSRRSVAAAAAWTTVPLAVWLLVRVAGAGPREILYGPIDTTIGFTDVVDAVVQAVAALLLLVAALRWPRRRVRTGWGVALVSAVPLALITLLTAAGIGFATDGFTRVTAGNGRDLRAGEVLAAGSTTALTYCRPGGVPLGMDVYEPAAGARRPAPVVLYVHGGGLIWGNRFQHGLGAQQANHEGALFDRLLRTLRERGMVVTAIDYRLAPLAPWPAQLQDAECAVRYLRTHAAALGVDPGKVGVWGSSSGGQLSAMLGTAAGADRVQAVVDMFGPIDFNALRDGPPFARLVAQIGLGGSSAVRTSASPLTYVAPGDPPFLILHGTADPLAPPAQSAQLAGRLSAAHVPVTLIRVPGAGHGLTTPGQKITPDELTRTVTAFFAQTLASGR